MLSRASTCLGKAAAMRLRKNAWPKHVRIIVLMSEIVEVTIARAVLSLITVLHRADQIRYRRVRRRACQSSILAPLG